MSDRYWVVIPAAGVGKRMGADIPKQYLPLLGKTLIEHTLDRFLQDQRIEKIYVSLSVEDGWWPDLAVAKDPRVVRTEGGKERCDSVLNALQTLSSEADDNDWVLVHDAARPCLQQSDLDLLLTELQDHEVGGLLGMPVRDTMKNTGDKFQVLSTQPREKLWHAFTPQMFRLGMLKTALKNALDKGLLVTDDSSAMELAGYKPLMIEGRGDNLKVTRPEDLDLANFYLTQA